VRLACVLDDRDRRPAGNLADPVHGGGLPVQMDDHHGPGARRDPLLELDRVDAQAHRVDVGEHRDGVVVQRGRRRSDEGLGGDDHLRDRAPADDVLRPEHRVPPAIARLAPMILLGALVGYPIVASKRAVSFL
jgi:hypothetical protein